MLNPLIHLPYNFLLLKINVMKKLILITIAIFSFFPSHVQDSTQILWPHKLALKTSAFLMVAEGYFYSITLGAEAKIAGNVSGELVYQSRTEIGDNQYYRDILLFSAKYYMPSKGRVMRGVYFSPVYRYSRTYNIPDQSGEAGASKTKSAGLLVGKNFKLTRCLFIDFNTGPFIYYNTNKDAIQKDVKSVLGAYSSRANDNFCWRLFVKLGIKIV